MATSAVPSSNANHSQCLQQRALQTKDYQMEAQRQPQQQRFRGGGWLLLLSASCLLILSCSGPFEAPDHLNFLCPSRSSLAARTEAPPSSSSSAFAGTTLLTSLASQDQRHADTHLSRPAMMEPPTLQAPPNTGEDLYSGEKAWVECKIEQCDDEECRNFESWVFKKEHSNDYNGFLNIRNLEPAGVLPGRFESGKAALEAHVSCRERNVDAELTCAECMRLVLGGPYGARGVAVPSYPPQPGVMGCLAQSKLLPLTKPQEGERWDGNQEVPRQTAFCNTINAGFPKE